MKTIKIILAFFSLSLISSGILAQSCDLRITDEDNTSGAYYSGYIQLWDLTGTPTQLSNEVFTNVYYSSSGTTVNIDLDYQVAPDIAKLKFYVYAINTSTLRDGIAWSANFFDSYDYYYNHPDVSLDIE